MMSHRLRAKRNSINQSGGKKKSKGRASNIGIILFFICNKNNYEMTFLVISKAYMRAHSS